MNSKKPNRRGFLKGGAAIVGAAAGAAQSARGQAPAIAAYSKKELIGYGERSHFVTSLREPAPGRPSMRSGTEEDRSLSSRLPVVVIGAGPVGLAAAVHLAARGQRFTVLEAGPAVEEQSPLPS